MQATFTAKPHFVSAYVQSKAKLAYNKVSDYLEQADNAWQPETPETAQQIHWLHQFTKARIQWRKTHSLLFKGKTRLCLCAGRNGKVQEIKAEYRRIANQIVEEAMIIAKHLRRPIFTRTGKNRHFQHPQAVLIKKYLENAHHFLMVNLANEQNQN
ncbi:ribonuclease II [Haemophilus influenzae]|uniref:Ribonuclease II n=1 Tax=Haemophilus influenzae TaxID=727 RepID=A0A2X1PKA4_HAEIF|nr:ribonuclease II [Haemophilus influenzae]